MLQKYSNKLMIFLIPIWVGISFFASQAIVVVLIWVLVKLKVPLSSINDTLLNTVSAALIYGITILIVLGLPWLIKKRVVSKSDLGLDRLPTWTDILITPAGLIVYLIISSILILLATKFLPGFDAKQTQDVGFSNMAQQYEYVLAFIILVIAVPFAEEVLFRGYLFGKLKKVAPLWAVILLTSILFAMLHGAWNVALDTFALSIVLCVLRQITGSIWPSILLHMTKNGIAFYFLFINTSLLNTLGK